jgi:hypothetical protein
MKVAEQMDLTAIVSGSRVVATWQTSDSGVLRVSGGGQITAMKVGTAVITATRDGMSASVTVHVVPDYGGTWTGLMSMSCERISGPGPISCSPDAHYRITLALVQQGVRASGTMDLFVESTVGNVTGQIDNRGHLVLQGIARNSEHNGQFTIEQWDTYLDDSDGQMRGTWRADALFVNGFGAQHQTQTFTLLDVIKSRTGP